MKTKFILKDVKILEDLQRLIITNKQLQSIAQFCTQLLTATFFLLKKVFLVSVIGCVLLYLLNVLYALYRWGPPNLLDLYDLLTHCSDVPRKTADGLQASCL